MEDKNLIGQRIKEAREQLGMSQEDLADALGLAFQSIQQWESGKTTPRANRMRKLAAILGKTPSWIQFGVASSSPENLGDIFSLLKSADFKTQVCSAHAKAMQNCISLAWVGLKRSDISLSVLADIFYSKLLEEYGLSANVEDEVKNNDVINS